MDFEQLSRQSFDRAAKNYDQFANIQTISAVELCSRIEFFKINPRWIIDLGSGTGILSRLVIQRFPHAQIISLDWSQKMLQSQSSPLKNAHFLAANAQLIPIKSNTIDLVVSNAMLQWSTDLNQLFSEIKRIMSDQGLFLFATFGPRTLKEWRKAWAMTDPSHDHTNDFKDMRLIADKLIESGLGEPVVDKETHLIQYDSLKDLARHLKGVGSRVNKPTIQRSLISKQKWERMQHCYPSNAQGKYIATWETIHGQCFKKTHKPSPRTTTSIIHTENITKL